MFTKTLYKLRPFFQKLGFDVVRYKSLPELLAAHRVDVVLDVGANDGGYGGDLRASGWQGEIISFEPQPHAFARLAEKSKCDHLWTCHQLGLGKEIGELTMNIYEMDVLSSFLVKHDQAGLVEQVKVEVRTLDSVLANLVAAGRRVFVKLDTQGFERNILKGCRAGTDRVIGWQLEMSVMPLYEKQMLIEQAIYVMRRRGYVLWKTVQGLRDPKTFQTYEMDGIFFSNASSQKIR
ncbi:MAG: FkbM family methyltransferase [Armatimonadetes bacterium]|nr:FkbM family methyltransferase [Akkermansiaceae bacterium]